MRPPCLNRSRPGLRANDSTSLEITAGLRQSWREAKEEVACVEIASEGVAGVVEESAAVLVVGLGPQGGDELVAAEASADRATASRASSPRVFLCCAAPVPGMPSMSTESPPNVLRWSMLLRLTGL